MTTFRKRAAHSVNRTFSLLLAYFLVISYFGVGDTAFVLVVLVPGHCLLFLLLTSKTYNLCFRAKIRTIMYTPVNKSGVYITRAC